VIDISSENLSTRIVQLRKAAALKQSDVGNAVGLSLSAISDMERGKAQTTVKTLIALADFFNVSIDYLLGRTDDPTPPPPAKGGDVTGEP
jgi:transcriptional regulator with XRE-family HTH domain